MLSVGAFKKRLEEEGEPQERNKSGGQLFAESSTVLPSRNSSPMAWRLAWARRNKTKFTSTYLVRSLNETDRNLVSCSEQIVESEKWREFRESSPHAPCWVLLDFVSFRRDSRLVTAHAWIPSFYEPISIISKADREQTVRIKE